MEDKNLEKIVILTDESGNEEEFVFIDLVNYEGKEYAVLFPADTDDGAVEILELVSMDEDFENGEYLSVDDDAILEAVFEKFKLKYQDEYDFE